MVWFPKICTVCYEYDAKKLEACSHCGSAFFCQAETHDRSAHSLYCAELKLHYGLCVGMRIKEVRKLVCKFVLFSLFLQKTTLRCIPDACRQ